MKIFFSVSSISNQKSQSRSAKLANGTGLCSRVDVLGVSPPLHLVSTCVWQVKQDASPLLCRIFQWQVGPVRLRGNWETFRIFWENFVCWFIDLNFWNLVNFIEMFFFIIIFYQLMHNFVPIQMSTKFIQKFSILCSCDWAQICNFGHQFRSLVKNVVVMFRNLLMNWA